MNNTYITTITIGYILCIILTAVLIIISVYNIIKDKESKERLFQIQLAGTSVKKLEKNSPPLDDLYRVVNDLIRFYVSRQLMTTNITAESDQQLSLLMDNIIVTISTEVERHLSDSFRQAWELYFDPASSDSETSHLRLYIATNVRTFLVKVIEAKKSNENTTPINKKQSE